MKTKERHWTMESVDAFRYEIVAAFVDQVVDRMESLGLRRKDIAERLGKTQSWVSRFLNDPGDLKLGTMIQFVQAVEMKIGVVAYNDADKDGSRSPVNPKIFERCWELLGQPHDGWELEEIEKWFRSIQRNDGQD